MYRRGDVGAVARALRLLDLLRGFKRGRLVEDLAAELGVSSRTVRRDLAELEAAGMEIERPTIEGRAAARLVERAYSYIAITRRERFTLLAVRSVFDVLRGTPFHEDIKSVEEKLSQRLEPAERAEQSTLANRIVFVPDGGTKAYDNKADVLDALLTGVLSRRVVRYSYVDSSGHRTRGAHLAPFAIAIFKQGLYVVGRRLKRPEEAADLATALPPACLAVERFTEAEHLRTHAFSVPADFSLDDVMHDSFGVHLPAFEQPQRVVVEFSKTKATFARARVWHRTQRTIELPDGRIRIEFMTRARLAPIVSMVLEWGPHARAVEPPMLVEQVKAELDAAREQYA
jgi:predicted DNA-binding transcriptional regulator YafY